MKYLFTLQKDLANKEPKCLAELHAILAAQYAKDDQVLPADLKGLPH